MKLPGGTATIAGLLSFNGGFVDSAGFLGLQGLFLSHVTGNFVTLGAAIVLGHHAIVGKLLALPEFILVVALARFVGWRLRARQAPVLRIMLGFEVVLLLVFFLMAVGFGPFPDADAPIALLTGFVGVAAMALQNAVQRVHLANLPPTTIMTGNTTQLALDGVDLLLGVDKRPQLRERFGRLLSGILTFALGCAACALLYWLAGFWSLLAPVVVGAAAALAEDGAGAP
jgi:uncharacterized membrane protein YoaK (UPF0700 family)